MMRGGFRRTVGSVAAGSLVLLATVMVDVGRAGHVSCGQVITQDTVLDANLGPCPGHGLVIGADNITLDLNGHTLMGTAAQGDGAGVLVENRTGVRVTNGFIRNFDAGVALVGGSGHTVSRLRLFDNIGSSLAQWGHGIVLRGSQGNRVSANMLVNNGPFAGIALLGGEQPSRDNSIVGNHVLHHTALDPGDPAFGTPDQLPLNSGIVLGFGQGSNRIEANVVANSLLHGIATGFIAGNNVIVGNTLYRNGHHVQNPINAPGHGLVIGPGSNRNTVERNTSVGNAGSGIYVQGGTAAFNPNNVVRFNRAFGNNPSGLPVNPDGSRVNADLVDITGPSPCDNNLYAGNQAATFRPPCVMAP